MKLTSEKIAWAAGLFEGEGCIGFGKVNSVHVRINMTDRDVLETLNSMFPAPSGVTVMRAATERTKTCYRWQINRVDSVRGFLQLILPYLHERRADKARAALERLEKNLGPGYPGLK